MSIRKKGLERNGTHTEVLPSVWLRTFTPSSKWPDKDEFLDVVYWLKQIVGLLLGLAWGLVPLKGVLGIAMYWLCMDIKNVRKWCREFNEGRINVHDEQRSGRPSLPESTVARIDEMVRANRQITLEEIEDGLNEDCSHFSVHKIVSETLGYRKVSARYFVINAILAYLYSAVFQGVDMDDFGGIWDLIKEGLMTALAGFLVSSPSLLLCLCSRVPL
ncbi:C20orf24 [Cordylochernes scorpioides]|uniref:C20orf24 n=1 Tax=Cordylochernes scorpioides TaxID=51811 RepID=A0ABY6K2C5_9ARAC|nr:C20orf24 [Cordylochernes scorpioides]